MRQYTVLKQFMDVSGACHRIGETVSLNDTQAQPLARGKYILAVVEATVPPVQDQLDDHETRIDALEATVFTTTPAPTTTTTAGP